MKNSAGRGGSQSLSKILRCTSYFQLFPRCLEMWSNTFFTITAEILARSLANFYCQYADRHMNLKICSRQ